MSQLNPFIGSILQTPQAQRLQSEQRDARVRRAQQAKRNSAAGPDEDVVQVEGADELDPAGDALQRRREKPRPPTDPRQDDREDDDSEPSPRLDVRA